MYKSARVSSLEMKCFIICISCDLIIFSSVITFLRDYNGIPQSFIVIPLISGIHMHIVK